MGLFGPKGDAQGEAQGSQPKGLYKQRRGAPKNPICFYCSRERRCRYSTRRYSTHAREQYCATVLLVSSATPPVRQARGRIRGPSSPDRDASTRTCGYLGGAASAAQGRAAREEVLATALPASICTTLTRYRSSATARLVVIP